MLLRQFTCLVCIREINYITQGAMRSSPELLRYVEDIDGIKCMYLLYLLLSVNYCLLVYAVISEFHNHTGLCK